MKLRKVFICLCAAVAFATAVSGCTRVGTKKEATKETVTEAVTEAATQETIVQNTSEQEPETIEIKVVIDGSQGEDKAISCSANVGLPSGATAYDALKNLCDSEDMEITGDPSYIKTIGGLGDGSFGAAPCGWMFSVNGEYPPSSADETVLEDGDEVIWEFAK